MDKKTVAQFFFDFNALNDCIWRNLVRGADGFVRLKKGEAVFKLDLKSIFPLAIACVFDGRSLSLAERGFERIQDFHNLCSLCSFCNCRIISTTFRGGFQSSSDCIVSSATRPSNLPSLSEICTWLGEWSPIHHSKM